MKEITQGIYKILTRKFYNRDEPCLESEILKNIDKFVNNNKPIKLVGFWGTGPKNNTNLADLQSCEFLFKQKNWWNEIENRKTIEHNAKNRNKKLLPKIAAQKYYIMRDLEKEMLKKEFSGFIFHAFSDSSLKNVLPSIPTLFFYARKGWSNAPWFVVGDK